MSAYEQLGEQGTHFCSLNNTSVLPTTGIFKHVLSLQQPFSCFSLLARVDQPIALSICVYFSQVLGIILPAIFGRCIVARESIHHTRNYQNQSRLLRTNLRATTTPHENQRERERMGPDVPPLALRRCCVPSFPRHCSCSFFAWKLM